MKIPKPWLLLGVFLFPTLLCIAGCGNANLSKVEGVVTLDGAPLPGAMVSFMPVGGGRAASGLTGGDGYFQLTTFRTDDGALAGDYRVIVVLDEQERKDVSNMTNQEKQEARIGTMTPQGKKKQAEKKSKKRPQVPEIYSDIKKTPLKEVVPTNGKIELALKGQMR